MPGTFTLLSSDRSSFKIILFVSLSKCQKYSPTESNKANDKAANRKGGVTFDPKQVVEMVKQEAISGRRVLLAKEECIKQYIEVGLGSRTASQPALKRIYRIWGVEVTPIITNYHTYHPFNQYWILFRGEL